MITFQIESVLTRGQNQITILDIGCGDGSLLRDFMQNRNIAPHARQLLRQYPELQINLIGITDAHKAE